MGDGSGKRTLLWLMVLAATLFGSLSLYSSSESEVLVGALVMVCGLLGALGLMLSDARDHQTAVVEPAEVATPQTPEAILSMQGIQDLLEVFEDSVTITPYGVLGFLNKGMKGTKTIPFESISATQFREAGALSGYIQFSIPGGNESRGGVLSATADENSVMFQQKDNDVAKKIRDHIQSRLRELRTAPAGRSHGGLADELQRLASMRDQGILSEAEFTSSKNKLLG